MDTTLQEAENIYIIHGVQDNIRCDGRNRLDYRTVEFETDVIPNCNGSAFVKVGDTKLLAGVKVELTSPLPNSPDKGWFEVSVECTPRAVPEFEGKGGDDFASEISHILMQACNNDKLMDLKSLCVIPAKQVWGLYIDIMVLGFDGNLLDAASLATKAALHDTKIQSVTVKSDGENEPEIEVSDDPYDVFSIDVTNLPICVTFFRIGNEFVIDANKEEESCCKAKVVLAVSPVEMVMMKEMGGQGSLHIESVSDVIEAGEEMGLKFQREIMEKLKFEKTLEKRKKLLP